MQTPKFIDLSAKKLVGLRIQTTLSANQTVALWRQFKPLVQQIQYRANSNFYSIEVYDASLHFNHFSPTTLFEKWAAVEVTQFTPLPEGLEMLTIPDGTYAVFIHHGPAHTFPQTAQYIFGTWLPTSDYQLDHRPHFEIMTPNYLPNDVNAEEEIWIPVKKK